MSAKKVASKKFIYLKWKEQLQWLNFTKDEKMVCTVCTLQEEKICLMQAFHSLLEPQTIGFPR